MPLMRWLVAALTLVSALALAQAAPDAGTPRPRAARAPVKALGSGKDDEGEAPPAPKGLLLMGSAGTTARTADDADRGLLKGLLFAFEPAPTEIRVIAVEDLGLLGDPRALNALAQMVMDPNPVVQAAAIRAIRNITHPRAEAILANVVRHPSIGDTVKSQAIEALLFQNSNSALAFIAQTARGGVSPAVQSTARRMMMEVPIGRVP